MILAIDMGNSFTKLKLWGAQEQIELRQSVANDDENIAFIKTLMHKFPIQTIIIASVAKMDFAIQIQTLFSAKAQVLIVKASANLLGVKNAYQQAELLGVDRWVAMIEAFHRTQQHPVCVIDIGTAVTLDVVDEQGQHQGGFIVPGLQLMTKALQQSTQQVKVNEASQSITYGKNTNQAVGHGIRSMLCHWINNESQNFKRQYPTGKIYLTGGTAPELDAWLDAEEFTFCEDLVLDGLRRIATEY